MVEMNVEVDLLVVVPLAVVGVSLVVVVVAVVRRL